MIQENLRVLWNESLGSEYFRLGFRGNEKYHSASPGQFVMLRIPARSTTLLRRPFSIHRRIQGPGGEVRIEVLYRVVGKTTRSLSEMKKGDTLDIVGPLGRGFTIPEGCKSVSIAAGGIGVAPLLFLAEFLLDNHIVPKNVSVFIGGKTEGDLLCLEDFSKLGMAVACTTDDGSSGDQCLVTHPLEQAVGSNPPDIIYACGPPGMLTCISDLSLSRKIPCQLSVETIMACGIGACLGCAVERRAATGNYLHACRNGPVFMAHEIQIPSHF